MRAIWFACAFALLCIAQVAVAAQYYEDDRSQGDDVPGLPHYRSPEEACIAGVLIRKVQGYEEGDNRQYRYVGANVGSDDGFAEFACQGVIERRFYYPGANWVTVEEVATNVYGPFGNSETCALPGYLDPETGQCGPPKCNDTCCSGNCGNGTNPIQTASGNKHQVETDFTGAGFFPLKLLRTYDSQRIWLADQMPVGIGWTHSYLGQIVIAPPQGSSTLSEAIVYRPDGRILRFNLNGNVWVADADVPERLSVTLDSSGNYVSAILVTQNDEVENYDQLGRLASITNRGGLIQTLNYTTGPSGSSGTISHNYVQSVTDPQGRSLTFGYDAVTGRLINVADGNGATIRYAYDSNGNLQTVAYPDVGTGTKTRTYYYNESGQTAGVSQANALTGIQDENVQRYASWGYDASGRANLSVRGPYSGGTIDRTALVFNSDGSVTVTDGLGQARIFGFTAKYLVAHDSALNQPCDYCETLFTSRAYDANGYPANGTDFRGTQTTFAYTAVDGNGDPRGLETQRDEAVGQSEERITNTTWDPNFRVPDQRTILNHSGMVEARTNWVYNSRGQPLARCEYANPSNAYVCSASGTPPAGIRRWVYAYCDAVDQTQCPLVGLPLSVDGPRTDVSDVTTYTYRMADDTSNPPLFRKGDLWKIANALGQVTEYRQYDGNGRPLRVVDVNGVITDFTWHPRGWMLSRTVRANANGAPSPNDAITSWTYDGAGNISKLTQPDGVFTSYAYDNAHRLTKITDALGNHIDYTLDALGHRTGENTYISGSGTASRALSRLYSSLARLTQDIDAYGKATAYGYDGNGNRTDQTDPLGVKSHWDYDGLNRIKDQIGDYQGTNAGTANSTIGYAYDTRDNLTAITDPDGLSTHYQFDGLNMLGQLQSPDTGTSSYINDAAGNRVSQTDARNVVTTYSYDALNRLTRRSLSHECVECPLHLRCPHRRQRLLSVRPFGANERQHGQYPILL